MTCSLLINVINPNPVFDQPYMWQLVSQVGRFKEIVEEMTDANQAKMNVNLEEMREEIKSVQVEMKSTVSAIRFELEDVNHNAESP